LGRTFSYAAVLFDANHTALARWLKDNYGIFPAFSGMGFSVKDSYSLDTQPMTSQQILVKSISSEYILKNVSLSAAGCRCIVVPPIPAAPPSRLTPISLREPEGMEPAFKSNGSPRLRVDSVERVARRQTV